MTILLAGEDLQAAGVLDVTLDKAADMIRQNIMDTGAFSNVSLTPTETADGEPAYLLSAYFDTMNLRLTRLLTLHDGRVGYYVTFIHTADDQAAVEYMVGTFRAR